MVPLVQDALERGGRLKEEKLLTKLDRCVWVLPAVTSRRGTGGERA